ncbi:hypothetical protein ACHAWF_010660 [Thalassiosira exigua]
MPRPIRRTQRDKMPSSPPADDGEEEPAPEEAAAEPEGGGEPEEEPQDASMDVEPEAEPEAEPKPEPKPEAEAEKTEAELKAEAGGGGEIPIPVPEGEDEAREDEGPEEEVPEVSVPKLPPPLPDAAEAEAKEADAEEAGAAAPSKPEPEPEPEAKKSAPKAAPKAKRAKKSPVRPPRTPYLAAPPPPPAWTGRGALGDLPDGSLGTVPRPGYVLPSVAPPGRAAQPPVPARVLLSRPPGDAAETALRRRQRAEFDRWLVRWNNYQSHLSRYWQGRCLEMYKRIEGEARGGGGGGASKSKRGTTEELGKKKRGRKRKADDEDGTLRSDRAALGRAGQKMMEALEVGTLHAEGEDLKKEKDSVQHKWTRRYDELVEFCVEHGHTNVPKQFKYKHTPPLGHWVSRMRNLHRRGLLDASRERKLLDIGFEFEPPKNDEVKFSVVWNKAYLALRDYFEKNGNVEVPPGHRGDADGGGPGLDGWIVRQRKHYRAGRLPEHLQAKLRGLGVWLGGRGRPFGIEAEASWKEKYLKLVKYSEEHGDCDVPPKSEELGAWVKSQRDMFNDGMVTEERITQLTEIGFNFYARKRANKTKDPVDPWQRRLMELRAYKEKVGDVNVPRKFALNLGLGDFVYNQKMAYKDGKLSEEKIQVLEELGFDWTVKRKGGRPSGLLGKTRKEHQTQWEKRFSELVAYREEHGDLRIPDGYERNPTLASWMRRQRKYHREGMMKDTKCERLKELGFDFGGPKQEKKPWMKQYEALVEFNKEHGHNNVPVHHVPNPQLYYWIGTQKQTYKKGKMTEDKIALLKEIDFDFAMKERAKAPKKGWKRNTPFLDPAEFEKLIKQLADYKDAHGDVDVPQRQGRLGAFVHYMRFYVKSGKLSQDYVDRLNGLGFSWNVTEDRWNAKYEGANRLHPSEWNNATLLTCLPTNHFVVSCDKV